MIDINCDIGEHFGVYRLGDDEAIMPFITSVNIACGFHAGDPKVMFDTIEKALRHNLNIGAHPGYDDKIGFGRRHMEMSPSEVYYMTLYQIGALDAMVKAQGGLLNHVKAHGALYNRAAEDLEIATAIVKSIVDYNPELKLYGLGNTQMALAAKSYGIVYVPEVFADRNIGDQGLLVPRSHPKAMIEGPAESAEHIRRIMDRGEALSINGNFVKMEAETVCVHGDNAHAVAFAKELYQLLKD